MPDYTGENWPMVQYGKGEYSPVYFRVCPVCSRFVKADQRSTIPEYLKTNATCAVHGRVAMPFCCWASDAESEGANAE